MPFSSSILAHIEMKYMKIPSNEGTYLSIIPFQSKFELKFYGITKENIHFSFPFICIMLWYDLYVCIWWISKGSLAILFYEYKYFLREYEYIRRLIMIIMFSIQIHHYPSALTFTYIHPSIRVLSLIRGKALYHVIIGIRKTVLDSSFIFRSDAGKYNFTYGNFDFTNTIRTMLWCIIFFGYIFPSFPMDIFQGESGMVNGGVKVVIRICSWMKMKRM